MSILRGLYFRNLSDIHLQIGDNREAVRYHRQALDLVQKVNDRATQASVLSDLGIRILELQQYNSAMDTLTLALELSQEIGYWELSAQILKYLADWDERQHQMQGALDYCDRTL
jgi:tetratricopeptide (TPR) repeat protein